MLFLVNFLMVTAPVYLNFRTTHTQNFSQHMKSVTESRFFTLFRSERFDRLEIEIVVQMQVIEILTMDEQIEHIVPLSADL